jgi:hypothetical protein
VIVKRTHHTALYGVKFRKADDSANLTLHSLHPLHKYSRIIRGILGIARTDGMREAPGSSVELLARLLRFLVGSLGWRSVGRSRRSERLRSGGWTVAGNPFLSYPKCRFGKKRVKVQVLEKKAKLRAT